MCIFGLRLQYSYKNILHTDCVNTLQYVCAQIVYINNINVLVIFPNIEIVVFLRYNRAILVRIAYSVCLFYAEWALWLTWAVFGLLWLWWFRFLLLRRAPIAKTHEWTVEFFFIRSNIFSCYGWFFHSFVLFCFISLSYPQN